LIEDATRGINDRKEGKESERAATGTHETEDRKRRISMASNIASMLGTYILQYKESE